MMLEELRNRLFLDSKSASFPLTHASNKWLICRRVQTKSKTSRFRNLRDESHRGQISWLYNPKVQSISKRSSAFSSGSFHLTNITFCPPSNRRVMKITHDRPLWDDSCHEFSLDELSAQSGRFKLGDIQWFFRFHGPVRDHVVSIKSLATPCVSKFDRKTDCYLKFFMNLVPSHIRHFI